MYNSGIDVFVLEGGKSTKFTVNIASDNRFDNEEIKSVSGNLSAYAVSPDAKK
ncbi:hypothetical protein [Tenacibaculum sp. SG-28]|uniref:hypothetical protein n=1 Tax=Tenacibaculum sp. SG-28 TaxID=754426 RepID=UPI001E41894C|nr:hypothetical protein [Tenacibaculum sp. SG-28]